MTKDKKERRNEWFNRGRGCFIGGIIGDSFGVRYELLKSDAVSTMFELDKIGGVRILGGGPYGLVPGQLTEDGEMAIVLARSILKCHTYNHHHASRYYLKWFQSSPPYLICDTLKEAFVGCNQDTSAQKIYSKIKRNALKKNSFSLSNIFLVRIPSLVIASKKWTRETLLEAVRIDCSLTHSNSIVLDAAKCYAVALRTAIITGNRERVYNDALSTAKTSVVRSILKRARTRPEPILIDDDENCSSRRYSYSTVIKTDSATHHSYFGVALQNAFYELWNGTDFQSSILAVARRGGATTTNCFVTGALLGALYGHQDLPPTWCSTVFQACPEKRLTQLNLCATHDLLTIADLLLKIEHQPKTPLVWIKKG